MLPCTFYAHKHCEFTLSVVPGAAGEEPVASLLPLLEQWEQSHVQVCGPAVRVSETARSHRALAQGHWRDKTAGGCRNHASWIYNPQYRFTVPEGAQLPGGVKFLLSSIEPAVKDKVSPVGVYVMKLSAPSNTKLAQIPASAVVEKAQFVNAQESTTEIARLEPGSYLAIPCTFEPGVEASFLLSIYAAERLVLEELLETQEVTLHAEWNESNAGGGINHSSWRKNTQYVVRLGPQRPERLSIRLLQHPASASSSTETHAIGLIAFNHSSARFSCRKEDLLANPACVAAPFGTNENRVASLRSFDLANPPSRTHARTPVDCTVELSQLKPDENNAVSFVLLPFTFYPDKHCPYTLSIFSPIDLPPPVIEPCTLGWRSHSVQVYQYAAPTLSLSLSLSLSPTHTRSRAEPMDG